MAMLKNHEKNFNFMQRLTDAIFISIFWGLAYYIRFFHLPNAQIGIGPLFLKITPFILFIGQYSYSKNGLYLSQRFTSRYKEIAAVLKANTQILIFTIIAFYFFAPDRISRLFLILFYMFLQFGMVILRLIVRNFLRHIRKKGNNLRHVLLLGDGDQLEKYIERTKLFKDAGINIIGWINSEGLAEKNNIKSLNGNVQEIVKSSNPDVIVVCHSVNNYQNNYEILRELHNSITPIQILPNISFSFIGHKVDDFAGLPLITLNQPKLSAIDIFLKRAFDFTASFIGLALISPVFLVIAIGVRLSSKGPIFYSQQRVGLDGNNFKMWKFRSMKVQDPNDKSQPGWTVENDPRRTKFGTFLRKTSLDELPQLWNVLIGDMSLVGPRPEQPFYVEKFKEEIPAYMLRHKMKAGITGWAQVNGWRGDTSLVKRIECDIYYIKNWSLWLDIRILFLTFVKGFINKNAY